MTLKDPLPPQLQETLSPAPVLPLPHPPQLLTRPDIGVVVHASSTATCSMLPLKKKQLWVTVAAQPGQGGGEFGVVAAVWSGRRTWRTEGRGGGAPLFFFFFSRCYQQCKCESMLQPDDPGGDEGRWWPQGESHEERTQQFSSKAKVAMDDWRGGRRGEKCKIHILTVPTNIASLNLVMGCSKGFFLRCCNGCRGALAPYKWHIGDVKTL